MSSTNFESLVKQWLDIDINPITRGQIEKLWAEKDTTTLTHLLASRISFGTAGLRAKMEAGFNRLNDVTVLQASQGLAKYVQEQISQPHKGVAVVGHDHRHNSREFAKITAVVFGIAGYKVKFLEFKDDSEGASSTLVATPFVPFAVDLFHADVGVMITASHNPAADNGYKVYWNNGCQIIPPHDSGIANAILENLQPWNGVWESYKNFDDFQGDIEFVKESVTKDFYQTLKAKVVLDVGFTNNDYQQLKFVYTPMHGVGHEFVVPIFEDLFKLSENINYHVVKDQASPDPDFKTVRFPNPEEKGALDCAIQTANDENVDLIIANDPDADRFSAAVRDKETGQFRQLTGNEIGFLFANYVIDQKVASGEDLSKVFIVNSTVSSQMIGSMAKKLGFNFCDTLTGFKWIGNKAISLINEGYDVPFGYEEAIGFMFGNVHDKDGLAATTVFLQLYYHYVIKQGISLTDKLEDGFKKFGYFKEFNGYYKFSDLTITEKIFGKIRSSYVNQPQNIGDFKCTYWRDLTIGYESLTPDHFPLLPADSSSQMITGILEPKNADDGQFVRFTARGSGTEPKLKVYIEGKSNTEASAAEFAKNVWFTLRKEWFKPDEYNLEEVHP
ncbi:phosphoribomutase [Saccharomycopsis crataegensis]|uniref:Phosphoribomutase n=1 Tax=Saccharomycopsis crataegensis TaxID=43959 RepID=A0AAV5QKL6_9ASCO|nr:phosphoribomutase [Saccharomycopsis crataegensis]